MSVMSSFSTGPLENQLDNAGTIAKTVWIKVENNRSSGNVIVRLRVFRLDGTRTLIALTNWPSHPTPVALKELCF